MSPIFTLIVVTSEDGYIARHPGHAPHEWASPEEQELFFAEVNAADWGIMGRGTHEAAPRPDRHRIVFSHQPEQPEWRLPHQLWINPATQKPDNLVALVEPVRALEKAVILGGTAVHDWFLAHGSIDRVLLTVEPVRFGGGLPLFSNHSGAPEDAMKSAGFEPKTLRVLNTKGTRVITWRPRKA